MKWQLIMLAVLAIQIASACKEVYSTNENITITDQVLAADEGAECNISLYNETTALYNATMDRNGLVYTHYAGYLAAGIYGASIECDTGATGECKFEVKEGENMVLGVIILLPLIIAALLLYGAMNMGEDHTVIKITAFLFTPILFMASLHASILALVKLYDFDQMETFIGSMSYWFIWVTIVIFIYFFIYLIRNMIKQAAQEKEARLNY